MTSYFDIRVDAPVGQVVRVPVIGDIDLESSDVFFHVLTGALVANGSLRVEVDLTGVTLIDASGIGVLLAVRNRAHARGTALRVYGAWGLTLQVLEITGVLGLLDGKADGLRYDASRTYDGRINRSWIRT